MKQRPLVGIIMGSESDLRVMTDAALVLDEFGIPHELAIVSAHRTPAKMVRYARGARGRGIRVIIAGAGGAAHLPGMVASLTTLPVIGVPVRTGALPEGWDAILSILQMPAGVPVGTVAINGARNAGILAAQILGVSDAKTARKLAAFKAALRAKVERSALTLARGRRSASASKRPKP